MFAVNSKLCCVHLHLGLHGGIVPGPNFFWVSELSLGLVLKPNCLSDFGRDLGLELLVELGFDLGLLGELGRLLTLLLTSHYPDGD